MNNTEREMRALQAVHREMASATEQSVELAELRVKVAELAEEVRRLVSPAVATPPLIAETADEDQLLADAAAALDLQLGAAAPASLGPAHIRSIVWRYRLALGAIGEECGRRMAVEAELAQAKDAAMSWKEKAERDDAVFVEALDREGYSTMTTDGRVYQPTGHAVGCPGVKEGEDCDCWPGKAWLQLPAARKAGPHADSLPCPHGCASWRICPHCTAVPLKVTVLCACIARSDLDTADPTCAMCHGKGEHDAEVF